MLLLALIWLQGIAANIVRLFAIPDPGEAVNGIWVSCLHREGFEAVLAYMTYPVLLTVFTAINYTMLKQIHIYKPCFSSRRRLALTAFAIVLLVTSLRYGGTALPYTKYSGGYQWKWLGISVQENAGDCN